MAKGQIWRLGRSGSERQTRSDLTDDGVVHGHVGPGDALEDDPHSTVTDLARFLG